MCQRSPVINKTANTVTSDPLKCPSRAGTSLILKKKELKHVISSISKKKGFGAGTKAGDIVSWLKEDFELGHGYAMAMVHAILNGSNIGGGFAYREWNAVTTLARGFSRG